MKKTKGPRVMHTDNSEQKRAMKRILKRFIRELEPRALDLVNTKKIEKDQLIPPKEGTFPGLMLLKSRKALMNIIKVGMEQRKDRETEIAVFAALVWFERQDIKLQREIVEEWIE